MKSISILFLLLFAATALARPPNIVIYLTDDQGRETISAYGGRNIETPNLDRLAEEGAMFLNAFASASSCAVSRSTILTGTHGHVNGMYGHEHGYNHFRSFDDVKSLPVMLKQAGYRTARMGKYHLGPEAVYRFDKVFKGEPGRGNENWRDTANMARLALDYVAENPETPFFLYMAPFDPHRGAPHRTDAPNLFGNREGGYQGIDRLRIAAEDVQVPNYLPDLPEVREEFVEFYESISRIDQGFGMLIDGLKKAGVYDDTLIIFLSDNGTPMPNAKTTQYDTGVKLPLIVKAPGQTTTGGIEQPLISWVDITPTVLDYAGVTSTEAAFNGQSFRPWLEGQSPAGFDRVFGSHTFHEITMYYPMRMVRTPQYKLIWNIAWQLPYPTGWNVYDSSTAEALRSPDVLYLGKRKKSEYYQRSKIELYDVVADPDEVNNLAEDAQYAGVVEDLFSQLTEFMKDTEDPWRIKLIQRKLTRKF
jgi:N-sulfoglucosamine sulfohydrolase